jgi:hypothetical protein
MLDLGRASQLADDFSVSRAQGECTMQPPVNGLRRSTPNSRRCWTNDWARVAPAREPELVRAHDFIDETLGQAIP